MNNGNIVSLISGGLIDPSKRREEKREIKRERRIDRRLAHSRPPPTMNARDRRRNNGDEPKGFIKKALIEVRSINATLRILEIVTVHRMCYI